MNKKLFTLDDFYEFLCENKHESFNFDSHDDNSLFVVQVPASIVYAKSKEESIEGLAPVTLQACHTNRNLNNSSISKEVMEKRFLPTFKNRPILGYIYEIEGEANFKGHEMHKDVETGETVYDEICVGIIPESNNAKLEYNEIEDRYDVIVDGYIFEDYTCAKEIIEREEKCNVSVELCLNKFSFDAKEKVLVIEDGFFSGVTILGYDDVDGTIENKKEIKPGMSKSNIKLKDFSKNNEELFFDEKLHSKLIETLNKVNETLKAFNTEPKEGGNTMGNLNENVFEETNTVELEKEIVEDENVEEFENEVVNEEESVETEETPTEVDDKVEDVSFDDSDAEDDDADENAALNEEESEDGELSQEDEESVLQGSEPQKIFHSVKICENNIEFSVSLSDVIYALTSAVNEMYSEDGTYYSVDVFADDSYVIMVDFWNGKAYKQSYKCKKDKYSLYGDRVSVRPVYLTADEESQLDKMRSNYSSIEAELNKYKETEIREEKLEKVFNCEKYSKIKFTKQFDNLYKELDKYSVDELIEKADEMLEFAESLLSIKDNKKEEFSKSEKKMFGFAVIDHKAGFLDKLLND